MSRDIKDIGMDVPKEAVVIAVLNSSGKRVMESIVETKASPLTLWKKEERFDAEQRKTQAA